MKGSVKFFFLLVFIASTFAACKKKEEEKCRIVYQVTTRDGLQLDFRASYTGTNGETVIEEHTGPIWTSDEVEREKGDYIAITVESDETEGVFDINVFKNSVPLLQTEMHNPSAPVTLDGNLLDFY